jgi:hypothetical protein
MQSTSARAIAFLATALGLTLSDNPFFTTGRVSAPGRPPKRPDPARQHAAQVKRERKAQVRAKNARATFVGQDNERFRLAQTGQLPRGAGPAPRNHGLPGARTAQRSA